jgi:hypothetical protein
MWRDCWTNYFCDCAGAGRIPFTWVAVIYGSHGVAALTGNIADFDFLNQLVPDGRILLCRRAE